MHHAVNFILFLFSCEAFAMDQCKKWEAGVVVVSSRTSDRSTAPQSLYNLRILKRFSVVPRMKEASAPGPAPQRCRRPWQGIIRHKPHLSCSVLEWRPECSDILNLMLLLLHSFTGSLPFAQVHHFVFTGQHDGVFRLLTDVFLCQRCARSWHIPYPNALQTEFASSMCFQHHLPSFENQVF